LAGRRGKTIGGTVDGFFVGSESRKRAGRDTKKTTERRKNLYDRVNGFGRLEKKDKGNITERT